MVVGRSTSFQFLLGHTFVLVFAFSSAAKALLRPTVSTSVFPGTRMNSRSQLQLLPSQASELVEASSENYRRRGEGMERERTEESAVFGSPPFGDGIDDADFYDWNRGHPDVVAAMSPDDYDSNSAPEATAATTTATTNAARHFVARVFGLPSSLIRRHPHPASEGLQVEESAVDGDDDVVLFPIVGCRLVTQDHADNNQRVRSLPTVGNPACRIRRWDEPLIGWFRPRGSAEEEPVESHEGNEHR